MRRNVAVALMRQVILLRSRLRSADQLLLRTESISEILLQAQQGFYQLYLRTNKRTHPGQPNERNKELYGFFNDTHTRRHSQSTMQYHLTLAHYFESRQRYIGQIYHQWRDFSCKKFFPVIKSKP